MKRRSRFKDFSFSEQLIFSYVVLFLMSFSLCMMLYFFTVNQFMSRSEEESLEYGLKVAQGNIESMIENVNNCSKVIAYNDTVQKALQEEEIIDYAYKTTLQETIIRTAACYDGISSVYLFDNKGNSYISGDIFSVEVIRRELKDISEFQEILNEAQSSTAVMTFSYETANGKEETSVAFVRLIRNLNTFENLGILVINIPIDRILNATSTVSDQTGMAISVSTESGTELSYTDGFAWLNESAAVLKEKTGENISIQYEGKRYKIGAIHTSEQEWFIVGAVSRNNTIAGNRYFLILGILLMCFGIALNVLGTSYVTNRIRKPLANILFSMEAVKNGKLNRIEIIETNKELDDLQYHYNQMLEETENLMQQKITEQRLRRKYELSLLQEQIKPHFLYNTFDSVCALAAMGRTDDVYTMMQALGKYYRNSLQKGQTMISIKDEISIVKNYLIIQAFRYDDVFVAEYDIDDAIKDYQVIKLILQPLAENAIYHGFREHDLSGTITIRAKDAGEYIMLQVEDDGIGMREEKLNQLIENAEESKGKRFGLFGTIARINLYYQNEKKNLVDIKSEYGEGTTITVWIPKKG